MDGRRFDFTPAILQDLADSYDPELRGAPLVVGHPKLDDPAYGWVKGLSFDGKQLTAEPHQVEAGFAEWVNAGRYPNRSMEIYLPDTPGNPKPGHHYLKHVGFLGAVPPAITGLAPVRLTAANFAADDEGGTMAFAISMPRLVEIIADMFQRWRDRLIETDGLEKADAVIPQWQIRSLVESAADASPAVPSFAAPSGPSLESPDMSNANAATAASFAERETALNTREQDLVRREGVIADQESKAKRAAVIAFADSLVAAGKLTPAEHPGVVEVLVYVDGAQALSFAEAGGQVEKSPREILQGFLEGLPPRIKFGEQSGADTAPTPASFAAPAGMSVDPVRADLYARARAYQAEHPDATFDAAVKACGG